MVLRRVGVLSVGKISGTIGVCVGLIAGCFMAAFALASAALNVHNQNGLMPVVAGAAGFVIAPVLYGIFAFVAGIIYAAIYNFVAGFVGGIEMEFETIRSGI
jgi:hypothetical protein